MKFLLHWGGILMRNLCQGTEPACTAAEGHWHWNLFLGNFILHKESCQKPSWITEACCKALEQGCSNHALDQIKSNSEKRLAILQILCTLMHSPSHPTNSDHFRSPNSKKKVLSLSQHISYWKICTNQSFCDGRNWFESDWLIFVLFVCCLIKKLFSLIL